MKDKEGPWWHVIVKIRLHTKLKQEPQPRATRPQALAWPTNQRREVDVQGKRKQKHEQYLSYTSYPGPKVWKMEQNLIWGM
jgi:hypothetical protein